MQEAKDLMRGMRQQQTTDQVGDLAQRAEKLAEQQRDFANRMRQTFGGSEGQDPRQPNFGARSVEQRQKTIQLAAEKEKMADEMEKLEADTQKAARDMAAILRGAPSSNCKRRSSMKRLPRGGES